MIFKALNEAGYEIINTVHLDGSEVFANFDGSSRKVGWEPVLVRRVRPTRRGGCRPADLPHWTGTLIMRRSALDVLRDMLDAFGEVLPLATEDDVELFVFNPRVIDALDVARSEIEWMDGSILTVDRYVFIESAVQGVDLFRLPGRGGGIWFSDRFVARVKSARLKGKEFTKVWSSE